MIESYKFFFNIKQLKKKKFFQKLIGQILKMLNYHLSPMKQITVLKNLINVIISMTLLSTKVNLISLPHPRLIWSLVVCGANVKISCKKFIKLKTFKKF